MKNKTRILSAVVLLAVCIATLGQRDNIREAKPNEVPFVYNATDYGKVEIESVSKSVFQPGDIPTEARARLAITHPSLPKGIDFTNVPKREQDKKRTYLRKDEQLLNSFTEESFRPSLKSLKALIASITTNGN